MSWNQRIARLAIVVILLSSVTQAITGRWVEAFYSLGLAFLAVQVMIHTDHLEGGR